MDAIFRITNADFKGWIGRERKKHADKAVGAPAFATLRLDQVGVASRAWHNMPEFMMVDSIISVQL